MVVGGGDSRRAGVGDRLKSAMQEKRSFQGVSALRQASVKSGMIPAKSFFGVGAYGAGL